MPGILVKRGSLNYCNCALPSGNTLNILIGKYIYQTVNFTKRSNSFDF